MIAGEVDDADPPPPCAVGPCSRCGGRGGLEPDLDDCEACDTTGHRCVEEARAGST